MGKSPHTLGCVKIHKTKRSKLSIKLRNNMRRSISMGCIGIFGALALRNEPSGKLALPLGGEDSWLSCYNKMTPPHKYEIIVLHSTPCGSEYELDPGLCRYVMLACCTDSFACPAFNLKLNVF